MADESAHPDHQTVHVREMTWAEKLKAWIALVVLTAIPGSYVLLLDPWHVRTGAERKAMEITFHELFTNPQPAGVYTEIAAVFAFLILGLVLGLYTSELAFRLLLETVEKIRDRRGGSDV